ncbi:hypothetical protein DIPPA_16988 [Diplonema papillatum]|nr:hypothetical protein DIPPA_16988 [Diplonema papillatum]
MSRDPRSRDYADEPDEGPPPSKERPTGGGGGGGKAGGKSGGKPYAGGKGGKKGHHVQAAPLECVEGKPAGLYCVLYAPSAPSREELLASAGNPVVTNEAAPAADKPPGRSIWQVGLVAVGSAGKDGYSLALPPPEAREWDVKRYVPRFCSQQQSYAFAMFPSGEAAPPAREKWRELHACLYEKIGNIALENSSVPQGGTPFIPHLKVVLGAHKFSNRAHDPPFALEAKKLVRLLDVARALNNGDVLDSFANHLPIHKRKPRDAAVPTQVQDPTPLNGAQSAGAQTARILSEVSAEPSLTPAPEPSRPLAAAGNGPDSGGPGAAAADDRTAPKSAGCAAVDGGPAEHPAQLPDFARIGFTKRAHKAPKYQLKNVRIAGARYDLTFKAGAPGASAVLCRVEQGATRHNPVKRVDLASISACNPRSCRFRFTKVIPEPGWPAAVREWCRGVRFSAGGELSLPVDNALDYDCYRVKIREAEAEPWLGEFRRNETRVVVSRVVQVTAGKPPAEFYYVEISSDRVSNYFKNMTSSVLDHVQQPAERRKPHSVHVPGTQKTPGFDLRAFARISCDFYLAIARLLEADAACVAAGGQSAAGGGLSAVPDSFPADEEDALYAKKLAPVLQRSRDVSAALAWLMQEEDDERDRARAARRQTQQAGPAAGGGGDAETPPAAAGTAHSEDQGQPQQPEQQQQEQQQQEPHEPQREQQPAPAEPVDQRPREEEQEQRRQPQTGAQPELAAPAPALGPHDSDDEEERAREARDLES